MMVVLRKFSCGTASLCLGLVLLSGCSGGNSPAGESNSGNPAATAASNAEPPTGASTSTGGGSSYPMDEKEFAHRYNNLADPSYQIVSVSPNTGFDTLDLAPPGQRYITARTSGQYSLDFMNNGKLPDSTVANICAWMIRAVGPSISPTDAATIASKVTSNPSVHRIKIISDGVVINGSRDDRCYLMPTGL